MANGTTNIGHHHQAGYPSDQRGGGREGPPGMLLRPPVILVVEPSLTLRTLLPIMLRCLHQAQVFAFPHTVAALRHFRDPTLPMPTHIFLTKAAPLLSSDAALCVLKQQFPAAMRVLVMEDEGCLERIKAQLAGATDILCKPYTLADLARLLARTPPTSPGVSSGGPALPRS